MNTNKLKLILDNHLLYINSNRKEGTCANLKGANLYCADLEGANLTFIFSKYICHLSWDKEVVCIRIGCKTYPIKFWEENKSKIADKNDREWWDKTGQFIYIFLKKEAERLTKQGGND